MLQFLQPFMNEVREGLSSIRRDLNSLNESVNQLSGDVEEHKKRTEVELAGLTTKMETIDSKMETLHSRMQTSQETHTQQINDLNSKLYTMTAATTQLSTEHQNLQTNISDVECTDSEESLELYQTLQNNLTHQLESIKKKVDTVCARYRCGGTGWRRVVYLDMTDPTTICPSGWQLTTHSKRTCGRATTGSLTCDSAIFPVSGGSYTRVCGRIKAYQYSRTDAFEAYHLGQVTTIDGAYVAGVSLTHGSPRQHIWTFAAGSGEIQPTWIDACPCDASISISTPDFVGTDYFCESGQNTGSSFSFFPDDPLWDGQDCISSSSCCSFNTPPYFTKQFPTPTTDDIEARVCQLDGHDSPVELIELYVQ